MRTIKVTFDRGNTITTSINGTPDEIRKYYIGKSFTFGDDETEWTEKAVMVEFLDGLNLKNRA